MVKNRERSYHFGVTRSRSTLSIQIGTRLQCYKLQELKLRVPTVAYSKMIEKTLPTYFKFYMRKCIEIIIKIFSETDKFDKTLYSIQGPVFYIYQLYRFRWRIEVGISDCGIIKSMRWFVYSLFCLCFLYVVVTFHRVSGQLYTSFVPVRIF